MPNPAIGEGQRGRALLRLAVIVMVPFAALMIAQPWLKASVGGPATSMIGVALAIFLLACSTRFLLRWQRGLDEVESAGSRFGTHWGGWAGQVLFSVALLLPPFHAFVVDMVTRLAAGTGAVVDPRTVSVSIMFAFVAIILSNAIAAIALHAAWLISKR